jgi:hypothetical protein
VKLVLVCVSIGFVSVYSNKPRSSRFDFGVAPICVSPVCQTLALCWNVDLS